jgi:hypothetical protein
MAISLKHAFQSAVPDDGDPDRVGSNEWNAEHQLTLAENTLVGRGSGNGAAQEIPCTPFARNLLDDDQAATARATLGLGALATLASVGTNQIADDAVTYAKMQDISATSRILGRRTAGAGATEECTLSQILDFIGSAAQGDILYRGASAWQRLAAGTDRQRLITRGAGANPEWGGGRVTLASGSLSGSAVNITNIPQHYSMISLMCTGVSHNAGSDQRILIQASGDNGGAFSEFYGSSAVSNVNSTVLIASAANNLAQPLNARNAATAWDVAITIFGHQGPYSMFISATHAHGFEMAVQYGCIPTGWAINALRVTLSGGSFDAGTFDLYARN